MYKNKKIIKGDIDNIELLLAYIHENFCVLLNKLTEVLTMKAELNNLINTSGREEINRKYEDFIELVKATNNGELPEELSDSQSMSDELSDFFETKILKNKTIN